VRLLLGDAISRQEIDNRFRLDLEFAGQLVNSYLVWICCHAFLRFSLFFRFRMLFVALFRGFRSWSAIRALSIRFR
jgi:hypothetical protein